MQIIDDVYGRTLEYTPDVEGEMPSEEEILEGFGTMYGDALVFDKLHENKEYIQDLKDDYKSTEGKEFKGNLTDLIESDFEYWNLVDNSIIAGASETVLTFKDMSKEEKQRTMRRYDIYNRTNATGEGSRSFFEQLKGVGTGVALDMALPVGTLGKLFKFGGKLAGTAVTKPLLKKILFPGLTGVGWGAGTEYGRQKKEIALEARDELDPEAIQTSAAVGGALGPTAPLLVKTTGKGVRYIYKGVSTLANKTKRHNAKLIAQKKLADTLGGGPTAKKALVEEGRELLGTGDFESGSASIRGALTKGLDTIEKKYINRYNKLGAVDTSVSVLKKFSQKMAKDGVPTDNVNIIIGQAKANKITPTEALRKIRRELSNMEYMAKTSRDPATSAKSMLYKEWSDAGKELFKASAARAGKGKQASKLDDEYSSWLKFKKEADVLFRQHKDSTRISREFRDLVAAPELSPEKVRTMYSRINTIAKNADDPQMAQKMKGFIDDILKSTLFENDGAKFLKMLKSKEGTKGLKLLFPKNIVEFDDYHKIMKSAGNSPAQFFWGRMLAAAVSGGVITKGAGGTFFSGGAAIALTLFTMNTALKSKAFRNMAMNAYRAGKPQPKVINGMVKWLNNKGHDGNSIRDYLLGTATIAGGAYLDKDTDIIKETAVEMSEDTINTYK